MKKLLLTIALTLCLATTALAAPTSSGAVQYDIATVNGITLHYITVDIQDDSIGMYMKLTDDTLGATDSFANIVAEEGAIASVNANFFAAYDSYKRPVGNVMVGGELLYGDSGTPNMGFTEEGQLYFGLPGFFTKLTLIPKTSDQLPAVFTAMDTNVAEQIYNSSRIYTPAFGTSLSITYAGTVYTIVNDVLTSAQSVAVGGSVAIPQNGYLLYQSQDALASLKVTDAESYIGCTVDMEYVQQTADQESQAFGEVTLAGLLAGNSRLVADGVTTQASTVYGAETDSRWDTAQSRTAVGELADGRLILAYSPSARLDTLANALVELGCVNAINVDGGGSTAMAVDGVVKVSPGRALTCTLHIYDKTTGDNSQAPYATTDESDYTPRYQLVAETLSTLGDEGLMRPNAEGGFDLERTATRVEAGVMLVRLLGAEETALAENDEHPFTDVAEWADPYVGYLYQNGLTTGVGDGLYGSNLAVDANSYATFLLRALGHSDAAGDFTYDTALDYAQTWMALTPSATYYELQRRDFLRDDMAILTYNALNVKIKGSWPEITLAGQIVEAGGFTAEQATAVGIKLVP